MLTFLSGLSERRWLLTLALIAIVIRLPWAVAMSDRTPRFDEIAYVSHAESLCAGQGYVDSSGARSNYWPVGYPAVLALAYCTFGVSSFVGVGLQIVLLSLTCLLISGIGERTFGARIGRTAALLLAIYPNYVFYSTLMLTEPLCTLLLVSMTFLLLRTTAGDSALVRNSVGVGILAGFAALVRPSFLLLPMLLPFWARAQKMSWRQTMMLSSIVVLVSLVVMAPWMIRNHEVTGAWFQVSSNGGLVFWGGNHPDAWGGVARPESVYTDLGVGTANYQNGLGYRLGLDSMMSDIPATLRRSVQKLSFFFAIETDGAMWNLKGFTPVPSAIALVLIASFFYIAVMASGVFALVHGLRNRALGYWLLLLAAYSVAIAVVFESDPRYHFPLIPFLMIYSTIGILSDIPAGFRAYRDGQFRPGNDPKIIYWLASMTLFISLIIFNLWIKIMEGG